MRNLLIVIVALVLTCTMLQAKNKRTQDDVRRERQKTERAMRDTRKKIDDNRRRTARQLNALNSLDGQIARHNVQIAELRQSVHSLDSQIVAVNDTITLLDADIHRLRANYARSLRSARARRQDMTDLNLLFSSQTFSQASKRLAYIRRLDKWRAAKVAQLRENMTLLDLKRTGLAELQSHQNRQLADLDSLQQQLETKQEATRQLVADLRNEAGNLNAVLREQRQRMDALDRELDRIIAEEQARAEAERRKAEEEARKRAEQAAPDQPTTPAESPRPENSGSMAPSFADNRGKLLFPVAGSYNVVGHFGRNRHANLAKVEVENNGIDIEVAGGGDARTVFDGTVSSIFFMEGYHNIVMVRHGEYITVYANIDDLAVKKGDKVRAGQKIGSIFSDADDGNRAILHFEVRHEREKLNPLEWVRN